MYAMKLCMAKTDHIGPQGDKFRNLAKELECDEDEAAFEEAVKRIAVTPPEPEKSE